MGATLQDICQIVSDRLNESTVETGSKRVRLINRAVKKVASDHKWSWRKTSQSISLVADTQEYDLASDFDYPSGIFEVWDGSNRLYPMDYEQAKDEDYDWEDLSDLTYFYISPKERKIGIVPTPVSSGTLTVIYFAIPADNTTTSSEFTPSIPDEFADLVALWVKFLIHDSKRQRLDARNTVIDYREMLKDLRAKDVLRSKANPRKRPKPFTYFGFKRTYQT